MADILDIAVSITLRRHHDDVRESLIKTVFELFSVNELHFYSVSQGHEQLTRTTVAIGRCRGDASGPMQVDSTVTRGILAEGALLTSLQEHRPVQEELPCGQIRLCIPVIVNDIVSGLIVVYHDPDLDDSRSALAALVRLYSNFVGLIQEKDMDTLTGVLNRRAFEYQIGRLMGPELGNPKLNPDNQEPMPWWLVLLDVDHFKRVNDSFGHLIGDEILILIARLMNEHFRTVDEIYRYGGEEFAVLIGPSTQHGARSAVERLRLVVEQYPFPQVDRVTISCGMVPLDHYDHVSNVIGRADQALYYAKKQGRNRVYEFRELVEAGVAKAGPNNRSDAEPF
ncbi:MAG: GGDEF domain-containing protein [Marinobacter sp.]|uniref:GGDEF domain-containing protein n=1 Tax=Marinobacter sp. TaxID=50741 RepID=UPI00299EDD54|nr:GGDEF domain-containing protein [Marinobacter sp.]MDX1757075.1 GGDEF domain-containing protein [Marinobacter sp.]